MKKILSLTLIILFSIITISCEKEESISEVKFLKINNAFAYNNCLYGINEASYSYSDEYKDKMLKLSFPNRSDQLLVITFYDGNKAITEIPVGEFDLNKAYVGVHPPVKVALVVGEDNFILGGVISIEKSGEKYILNLKNSENKDCGSVEFNYNGVIDACD
ncbi:MAG: hypothetical protein ACEPOV_14740 [Hyphomicrobiales bacterium]